jgi:hypothetical protein
MTVDLDAGSPAPVPAGTDGGVDALAHLTG